MGLTDLEHREAEAGERARDAEPDEGRDQSQAQAAESDHSKIIGIIETCEDPAGLRVFMDNAQWQEVEHVREAAFRRLIEILPDEAPGTIGHDFWRTIHAFEQVLTQERGRPPGLAAPGRRSPALA
jgi:hypothetical protein